MKKEEPYINAGPNEEQLCSNCDTQIRQDENNLFRLYCPFCGAEWTLRLVE